MTAAHSDPDHPPPNSSENRLRAVGFLCRQPGASQINTLSLNEEMLSVYEICSHTGWPLRTQ